MYLYNFVYSLIAGLIDKYPVKKVHVPDNTVGIRPTCGRFDRGQLIVPTVLVLISQICDTIINYIG